MNIKETTMEIKTLSNGQKVIDIESRESSKVIKIDSINMVIIEEDGEGARALIFVDGVFSGGSYRPQAIVFDRIDDAYKFVSMISNNSGEGFVSCFNDEYQRVSVKPSAISMTEIKGSVLVIGVVGAIVQRYEFDCAQSAIDFKDQIFK